MPNDTSSRAVSARGFATLSVVIAIGFALAAFSAKAEPFAYVTNGSFPANSVSVIDTATNTVVATVPVGQQPVGVAVAPDGKHAYVTNENSGNVSVIDAATNTVVATVAVGSNPFGVAVAPDGKRVYVAREIQVPPSGSNNVSVIDTATNTVVAVAVAGQPFGVAVAPDGKRVYFTNLCSNNVSVIDTATNALVATVTVGQQPFGVAVTPDGKRAYVANGANCNTSGSNNVSVIDTATNTVVATVPVGVNPSGVAVTPDGKRAYVTNPASSNVSVIDTATNTVVATVPVGPAPFGIAFTPDGKRAYVPNAGSNNVSVIDTATNTVVGTPIPVGAGPGSVAIVPPPTCVPFYAFNAKLEIGLESKPSNKDHFELLSSFTLGSASNGINPVTEAVTLQIGAFTTTIPVGSFSEIGQGIFVFHGVLGGVRLEALIAPTGNLRYALVAAAQDGNLTGTVNPVPVTLTIGGDCGTASVQALIFH